MSDNCFPILGSTVPPMLGRAATLQRMINALTKATPDHLQVVGPRFAGKTVILNALASYFRQAGSPYSAAIVWDLGHQTPATDELFMQGLARELSLALKDKHPDCAELLRQMQGISHKDIAEVLELMEMEGSKVLAIMDGFDKPLSNGQLTRNLWDQMRELAQLPSLRLVTASRRTLRDLIRHPEAQTSDFWNIFDPNPVRIGCFDNSDFSAILGTIPDVELTDGARTELWNASNGFPILMLSSLNSLCKTGTSGTASSEAVNAACDSAFPSLRDVVDSLWMDCPTASQDLLRRVLDEGTVARTGVPAADAETLIERGFVRPSGNNLQKPCRFIVRYLDEEPNESSALVRLFGTVDAYQKNFRSVMERRIEQLDAIDETLKRFLERATEDLPGHPEVFLSNIRGIVNQAFELVWKAEVPDKRIPSEWMAIWKRNKEGGIDDWETTFPQGVRRVRLLNLMTGTEKSVRCAKYVTKSSYVLMNAVHAFGDFGQHQDGVIVDPCTSYAALHLCVELAAAMSRELPAA